MALTIGLVAGAAGAAGTLYGIGKIGQHLRPKKRLVTLLTAKAEEKNSVPTRPTNSLFSEGMREHQYRTISGEQEAQKISDVEREVNHYLTVSASSLALSVAGALFYPPLGFVGSWAALCVCPLGPRFISLHSSRKTLKICGG